MGSGGSSPTQAAQPWPRAAGSSERLLEGCDGNLRLDSAVMRTAARPCQIRGAQPLAAHRSGERQAAHHPPPTQPAAEAGPIFPCHQSHCHFTFFLRSSVTCASFSDHSGTEAKLTWLGFITLEICQWQIFSWEYCSGDPGRTCALSWGQDKVAADPWDSHAGGPT